jgi:cbb3-type cytochrome oxidase maturation protein
VDILILLVAAAGVLALIAGAAFMWALRSQQFDDPEMQAERILHDDDES